MEFINTEVDIEFFSNDELKREVLSLYNVEVIEMENIKMKDSNKPRAVYRVLTDKGTKCLKKVYYDESTLLFIYSVIEWLNIFGVNCPRLISTKRGLKYVRYKDSLFILTDWIDGRKCDYDNIMDVKLAAFTLAKIHRYSRGFKPIVGSRLVKNDTDLFQSLNKHFLQLLELSNKAFVIRDKFSTIFLDNFDHNLKLAQESVFLLSLVDFDDESQGINKYAICHLDFVNKNLIIDDEGAMHVIDFDKTAIDMPIHDLIYFLRRFLKRQNTSWNFELFRTIIESYESVRKLTYNEYISILSALMFPHKFWKISRDYYKNRRICNKDAFISIIKKIVKQQNDHELFINKLKMYIDEKFKE